jgi:putative DNA primase/helicase
LEALPKVFRQQVKEVSESLGVCPNLPFIHVLGVLSLACAKVFRIQLKPDFSQPANLYLLAPLSTAQRKSDVLKIIFGPVHKWESDKAEQMKDQIAEARRSHADLTAGIENLRRKLGKNINNDESIINEIEKKESALPDIPVTPVLTATDVTPERVAVVLMEQHERLAFVDSEGPMFANITGRYSSGLPNYDVFLNGHSEDKVRVMRKQSKEDIVVNQPTITFCVSPQPKVVRDLAGANGVSERGFLGRFLYCYPEEQSSYNWDTPRINEDTKRKYESRVRKILDFSFSQLEQESFNPILLKLTTAAEKRFVSFHDSVHKQLKIGEKLYPIKEWALKLVGATGRISLLLHVAKSLKGGTVETREVDADIVEHAISIANILIEHAIFAYEDMQGDPEVSDAIVVASWIVHRRISEFTKRECQIKLRSRFKKSEALNPVLEELCRRQIIRKKISDSNHGRPSEAYLVNPKFRKSDA